MDQAIPDTVTNTSQTVATWLMNLIDGTMDKLGLARFQTGEEIAYIAIVIVLAWLIGWVVQRLVAIVVRKIVKVRGDALGQELLDLHTITKCTYIIAPLVFLSLAPFAFESGLKSLAVIERVAWIYVTVAFGIGITAIMTFFFHHYNKYRNTRHLPIKGVLNVAKGITWIIVVIISAAIAFDKSPGSLLTGLGVFATALMLVFRDSILGFVAGIQMTQNDMLHVGDWIVVPSTIANGTVIDVSLSAVKVQNWDNTIVTVPPYTLVSTCLQNYRGMKESGARRITYELNIDTESIRRIDAAGVDEIVAKYPVLKDFVAGLRGKGVTESCDGGLTPINGTIDTNLGLFRAYISLYIYNSPSFSRQQQLLVRVMAATEYSVPLQIYCFTSTTDWDAYEGIQSALIEHLISVCKDFGLEIYNAGEEDVRLVNGQPTVSAAQLPEPPKVS